MLVFVYHKKRYFLLNISQMHLFQKTYQLIAYHFTNCKFLRTHLWLLVVEYLGRQNVCIKEGENICMDKIINGLLDTVLHRWAIVEQ